MRCADEDVVLSAASRDGPHAVEEQISFRETGSLDEISLEMFSDGPPARRQLPMLISWIAKLGGIGKACPANSLDLAVIKRARILSKS